MASWDMVGMRDLGNTQEEMRTKLLKTDWQFR